MNTSETSIMNPNGNKENDISQDPNLMQTIHTNMDVTIHIMLQLREKIRALRKELDQLTIEYDSLGDSLMSDLDLLGLQAIKTDKATLSISENTRPGINDWDAFCRYVVENSAFELLEHRATVKPCCELQQLGVEIPGIYFFTTRKVNLRVR